MFLCENNFPQGYIKVEAVMDPKDLEDEGLLDEEMANPCANHPSDHFSLAYQLSIRYE